MKSFSYMIKDENGMHARPAGLLVKECGKFKSDITIGLNGKTSPCNKLFGVMGLGVKQKDTVTITVEGEDEQEACEAIQAFFRNNL